MRHPPQDKSTWFLSQENFILNLEGKMYFNSEVQDHPQAV